MKVTATQHKESVICKLPQGKEVEIIMVSAEGEDYFSEPDLNSAPGILEQIGRSQDTGFQKILA